VETIALSENLKETIRIDAKGIHYRELNAMVREAAAHGAKEVIIDNVNGQRYLGTGVEGKDLTIIINGTPGNDLSAFMDGLSIIVNGNVQDGAGNTMNNGKIVVHGDAGDVLGYGIRGGKLFIEGDVGYRVGIHMKGYKDQIPVIVIGGTAGDFLGEYMAGGIIILLGLKRGLQKVSDFLEQRGNHPIAGDYLGTGMHGGVMYIRGDVDPYRCGAEVGIAELDEEDKKTLERYLKEFCHDFGLDFEEIIKDRFIKLYPKSLRPHGRLYAY
jgi:glutamate synthase domain-containing protein 3